jgi:hypothetical protein
MAPACCQLSQNSSLHDATCSTLTTTHVHLQVELPQVGLLQTAASRRVEFVFQPAMLDQLDIPHRVSVCSS